MKPPPNRADHANPDHGRTGNEDGDALVMSGTVERGGFHLEADLRAAPGEVLAVLGPNGAGKTTLLRALSGLVFQNYRLFPHLDVRAQLRSHIKQFAGPVLIITHDPLEAMIMADHLLVIENCRVVQQGIPAQVARQPATQYVARLVGLNLYTGTLDAATQRVSLDDGGTLIVTLGDQQPPAEEAARPCERPVLVGLRPSAITIHTIRPTHASPRNIWKGTVTALELLADRVRVQVDATPLPSSTSPPPPSPTWAYDPAPQCGSQPKPPKQRPTPTPAPARRGRLRRVASKR